MGACIYPLRSASRLTSIQQVIMHQHVAHPPVPETPTGLFENFSDTLLNAFSRVRKPDERFLAMRESVDKFEEGLAVSERLFGRIRTRTNGECAARRVRAAAV
jgi:sorting nexin-4